MTANLQNRPLARLDANGRVIVPSEGDNAFRGDAVGGANLIYIGLARPGSSESAAVWQIKKLAYDAQNNVVSITWPQNVLGKASNDYQFSWASRATLTYV